MSEASTNIKATEKFGLSKINLSVALAIAISAALVIVAIAHYLYLSDPNRKYDLARPGQKDNLSLHVEDDEADTTSPATASSASQKTEYLTKEINALGSVSKFDPDDLSDQNIQLTPAEQPSL
jgi:hypothetical protein